MILKRVVAIELVVELHDVGIARRAAESVASAIEAQYKFSDSLSVTIHLMNGTGHCGLRQHQLLIRT